MKKFFLQIVSFFILLVVLNNSILAQGKEEIKFVSKFLDIMCSTLDQTEMMKFISPAYMKANNLKKKDYLVNNYSATSYEIEEWDGNYVKALIYFNSDKTSANRLYFKVVKENDNLYLYPLGHTDNFYVHPWYKVETSVTPKKKEIEEEFTCVQAKELVTDFMDLMVNNRDNKIMMNFLSPKYFKDKNIKKKDFTVNTYIPSGFQITDCNYGMVICQIWGENKSWVHNLKFLIRKEGNDLFIFPGKNSSSYVDPWYDVEEYVTTKSKGNIKNQEAAKVVETFLKEMCKSTRNESNLWSVISPKYIKKNKLNKTDHKVNTYYPDTYEIESADDNSVSSLIYGVDKKWCHRLIFNVSKEDGAYYIVPSKYDDDGYIHLWDKVEANVEVKKTTSNLTIYDDDKVREFIIPLLKEMTSTRDNSIMIDFIAPSYFKDNNLSKKKYNVNYYYADQYKIISCKDGKVVANVFNNDKTFTHQLIFKIVIENGKYYVMPGRHSDSYVDPWNSMIANVDSEEDDPQKALVDEFLKLMCEDKHDGYALMKYISPEYIDDNDLDEDDYQVNTYYPKDYSIENSKNGNVVTKIWGKNKSWIHKLTFKVVKENGKYYLYPGSHSDSYIDPWYKITTFVK